MLEEILYSFLSVGKQVVILFILIGLGAICRRIRIMNDDAAISLTNIELSVVAPAILIASFQRTYSPSDLKLVGICAFCGFAFHVISIILAHLIVHDPDKSREIVLRFAVVFTNAGFMSLPLQEAILGEDGVFCGAVIVGVFHILCWTYGLFIMSFGGTQFSLKKIILSPGIIGITIAILLFVCRINLPYIIKTPLREIASLNTPLAMLIIGHSLAATRLGAIFRDIRGLFAIALRLLISPAITLILLYIFQDALFGNLPNTRTAAIAITIAAAAPTAAITSMFSIRFGHATSLSVELVSLSTLISAITMPVLVGTASLIFK